LIEYTTQLGVFKVKHVFFADKIKLTDFYKLVSYSYMRKTVRNPLFIVSKRQTRFIDLTQPFDQIFQNFGYYTRREIRRAKKKDFRFSTTTNINEFVEFYNDFAKLKNIELVKKANLKEIPNFAITKITMDEKTLAMYYYLTDKDKKLVRGFYGASKRLDQNTDSKLTSQANRHLHARSMEYFKEKGFTVYDWGGTAEHTKNKTKHQIDEFKKRFGGYIVDEYQYESIPHFLAINIKKIISQF